MTRARKTGRKKPRTMHCGPASLGLIPDCEAFDSRPPSFAISTSGDVIEYAEKVHKWLGQWILWAKSQRKNK